MFSRKTKAAPAPSEILPVEDEVFDAPPRSKPQPSPRNPPETTPPITPRALTKEVPIESQADKVDESAKGAKKGYSEVKQQALEKLNHSDVKAKEKKKYHEDDYDEVSDASGSGDDDLEPVEVLLQFIPFYGQGDPGNDSIVRSTLSSLSVEDIDSKDEYGNTLLLLACQYRCEDLVRIMLNKGADPNALNSSGACGLHFACYRESASIAIAKVLLKNGANPDVAETTYGCTPLHYCAGNGDLEFCKLLLSYGAQLNSIDYYNYSCVDYAREGQFDELADFLQQKLDKLNGQNQMRSGTLTSVKSFRLTNSNSKPLSSYEDMSEWESHLDPGSGAKYYINMKSGECLWESELKERISNVQQQLETKGTLASSKPLERELQDNAKGSTEVTSINQTILIAHATQSMLIAFLTKHDPSRLVEIEKLMEQYKNREKELFDELRLRYRVAANAQDLAFQAKLEELKAGTSNNLAKALTRTPSMQIMKAAPFEGKVSDLNMIDPLVLQDLAQEARKKLETQLEDEKNALRKKYETQLEDERHNYQKSISEKEGLIVKLQTEVETLQRAKLAQEAEITVLTLKISNLQASGGEALRQIDAELQLAKDESSALKAQIHSLQQELSRERDKLQSLEATLANLTSGQEELISREKAAAEERAEKQRSREIEFSNELKEVETKAKNIELKLKSDLNQCKNDLIRTEKQLREEFDQMKKSKDRENDALRRELAERKAQFAQDISAATMEAETCKRTAEGALKRAEEAEEYQRSVQNEIAEAKIIQKYNAQLHKDLLREQLARKKLHNDMEDLKGKIRVYVRVRPFSNSERERGCQEAVFKDGKMSVCVKGIGGPDQKKFFDFDQVFGGSEGNSQADIFKDTKHLIMSVIDGYNVCIFAYGQTGAGKSYTMIGGSDIGSCMNENGEFDESAGVTPRAISELFRLLNERNAQVDFIVEVQMFQLYRDALEDLLKDKKKKKKADDDDIKDKETPLKITLAEHSPTGLVYVEGAETMVATTPGEVIKVLSKGSSRRTTASTQMNAESSRSHLICSLVVKLTNKRSGAQSIGKLTLVDLAGSERVDKSGATGEQFKEAQSINKSLSALGDVIAALTTNQQHVPYRNHPLTMLMSDSIGGNAKTLMFVNTSPADYNCTESNNSLAFASRCKDITNMVAAGPGVQAAQMNALKKELAKLKKGGGGAMGKPMQGAQPLARPDTSAGGRK